ncbi:MAG: L-fucose:H+ symporter permease [Bacteroidales bacterium]|nr:L-fucose:H+ symporter permease [Bacteroidales bacterium]
MNKLVEKKYLLPFIAITTLFALWGFANDITNPMVAAFQTLMELPAAKASLIQFAFYGGYATMAVPAALFIRRYSYKKGILLGLALYAIGAFLFIPAAARQSFTFFCFSLYILTFGLAFLETTANPFILSLGPKENATRRLNLSQAFNPMGSLAGMAVASMIVLPNLLSDKRDAAGNILFPMLSEAEKAEIRLHDLAVIRDPYVALGIVVVVMFVIIALVKVPKAEGQATMATRGTIKRLWTDRVYREGVIAQVFYVAAQIMVWTFIIHYADNLGIDKATAQNYNILAMCLFLAGRFLSTWLMKYTDGRRLLTIFGICAALCSLGAILIVGKAGLYCLIGISFFMSLMFPTIYGTALENVSLEDASLGAAFLVMAIVGGALMPPLQGMIIDCGTVMGQPAVNVSYALPLLCFIIVTIYGIRASSIHRKVNQNL